MIGFSQGAMMSMQCLLINEYQFGAIIGYSGALRAENVEAAQLQIINGKHKYADTPVLLVHGTKDEVDSNGDPIYQGIDQSKLVPLLTAALQEAFAEIAALTTRIETLEAG